MSERTPVRLSESGQGLFSAQDIERLMRAEHARAARHGYELVLMLVGVDRLAQLQDLYGWESHDEILRAVIALLRESMRDSDLLGLTQDERILLVFPHTTRAVAGRLARRLIEGARKMRFDRDRRMLRVSLSAGIAQRGDVAKRGEADPIGFEQLFALAQQGLRTAELSGGDRAVEVVPEVKPPPPPEPALPTASAPPAAPIVASTPDELEPKPARPWISPDDPIGQALLELLDSQGVDRIHLAGLDPEAVAAAIRRAREEKQARPPAPLADAASRQEEIDLLERRIAKLTKLLGLTEEELRRVAAQKGVEYGLPSIYKTVQGLGDQDSQSGVKHEMMRTIFEANLKLLTERARLARQESPPKS